MRPDEDKRALLTDGRGARTVSARGTDSGMLKALLARLPVHSAASLARRVVRRADAARDARQWLAAAALYEEALVLAPYRHRLHIQAGHCFKETGHFAQAEGHYAAAVAALPADADLALQVGHFAATRGHLDEAAGAYGRALALDPGNAAAREALDRLAVAPSHAVDNAIGIVPDLLLDDEPARLTRRDQLIHAQIGRELTRDGAARRVMRGIEAIRAVWLASDAIDRVELVIDGVVVRTVVPERYALAHPLVPSQAKYVANIWQDFSHVVPGEIAVELRLVPVAGTPSVHRVALLVQPQSHVPPRLLSDSYIPLRLPPAADAEDAVNALPSVRRPALRPAPFGTPRAILVQRVDQLGDLVASAAALQRLRALFPAARIVGLMSSANADLAAAMPWFDAIETISFQRAAGSGRLGLGVDAQLELRRRLAAYSFDLAVDLGEGDASRALLRLSGAPYLYGFRPRDFPWLSGGVEADARDPLNGNEAMPHSRRLLALVEGLASLARLSPVTLTRESPSGDVLATAGLRPDRDYLLIHTGARLKFSRWPHAGALATLILEQTDLDILFMTEADDEPADLPASSRLKILSGRLPFDTFDALVSGAKAVVGNDSGPKHLAALRGVPVVSVHSARINWGEWGQEASGTIVSRRVPCAGCGISDHPEDCGKALACIRLIRPDEVLAAVLELVAPA